MGKLILGLVLILGLLGTALAVAAMLPAGGATITAVGGTTIIGQDVVVSLELTGAAGVGALTVDVEYDPSVLAPVSCTPTTAFMALCNPNYPGSKMRVAGANAVGVSGDVSLMTMTFHALAVGVSPLDVQVVTFADTTPVDMAVQAVDGVVNAIPVATPTQTATPNPTSSISPTPTPIPWYTCGRFDVNEDGKINILDLLMIVKPYLNQTCDVPRCP